MKTSQEITKKGFFREDLLYRINTIQIKLPPLRDRLQDIPDLLEIFLNKYNKKYRKQVTKPGISIINKLQKYSWPGNIREFENKVEKAVILGEDNMLTLNDFVLTENGTQNSSSLKLIENEILLIQKAIKKSAGNYSLAAKELGISRKTLYNKINKYDI